MKSPKISGSAADVEPDFCFHCSLPIPSGVHTPGLEVFSKPRKFCCVGCHAVCETIVDAGLDDYYKYRKHSDAGVAPALVPDILQKLEIYDRPEIQKGFVHSSKRWSEAALILEDIRCAACLWLNERHLRHQPGVLEVAIDGATQRMRVRWDPGVTRLSEILKAVAEIGYIAHPYDAKHSEELNARRRTRSIERLIFAGLFGMMVMNFSIATYVMGGPDAQGVLPLWEFIGRWMSLGVSIALLAYPAQDFWIGAWRDLQRYRLGMDVPIVLGMSAAFLGSLYALLTGTGEVYFDSIAMFVFFVLLARHFETSGRIRAMSKMDHLSRAIPQLAYRLAADAETWEQVPVLDLSEEDIVRVLPGETVPVDGVITAGKSSFDEALLTGESMPVVKAVDDAVVAGSINGDQPVRIAVQKVGQETMLDTIRRLVDRGLEQKPRSAQLADRVARYFVAAILVIAVLTSSIWYVIEPQSWLSITIAVLIVTCPCALALATPVALAVSAGRFVDMGVLPLRMNALEALAKADTVVFDKTGTLTTGEPEVIAIQSTGSHADEHVLEVAAAIASVSEHPLARALRRACPNPHLVVEAIENVPGEGMTSLLDGKRYWLGRVAYIEKQIALSPRSKRILTTVREAGNSLAILADEDDVQAVFSFSDSLRSGAKALVDQLRDQGIDRLAILSGDTSENVARIANVLGIEGAWGGMLPADKLARVAERQRRGEQVLMFGDGINDAPTLAAADASVSLTGATDMANLSSDFILLGEDISVLADARKMAIKTQRNIRQNMRWAILYNLVAVPFAAFGFVPPWVAAIGMSASSLIVVLNALRLKRV